MGTKFGHISVFDSSLAETKRLLEFLLPSEFQIENFAEMFEAFTGTPYKPDPARLAIDKQLFAMVSAGRQQYQIAKNSKLITVFSEVFGFENIENTAKNVSGKTDKKILATSVFDDQVFVFSVLQRGTCLATHVSGGESYGVKSQAGDAAVFAQIFEVTKEQGALESILNSNDFPWDRVPKLEQLLGVKLWLLGDKEDGLDWKRVKSKPSLPPELSGPKGNS